MSEKREWHASDDDDELAEQYKIHADAASRQQTIERADFDLCCVAEGLVPYMGKLPAADPAAKYAEVNKDNANDAIQYAQSAVAEALAATGKFAQEQNNLHRQYLAADARIAQLGALPDGAEIAIVKLWRKHKDNLAAACFGTRRPGAKAPPKPRGKAKAEQDESPAALINRIQAMAARKMSLKNAERATKYLLKARDIFDEIEQ